MELKKKYRPVVRYVGTDKSYMEFGRIDNATYRNVIYKKVRSKHKGKWNIHYDEMRIDEAITTMQGILEILKIEIT